MNAITSIAQASDDDTNYVTVQAQNNAECDIIVRKNNDVSEITSISLSSESGKTSDDLDKC